MMIPEPSLSTSRGWPGKHHSEGVPLNCWPFSPSSPSGDSGASLALGWLVITTTEGLVWSATFSKAFSKWRARSISPVAAAGADVAAIERAGYAIARRKSDSPRVNQRVACDLKWEVIVFIRLVSTHVGRARSIMLHPA